MQDCAGSFYRTPVLPHTYPSHHCVHTCKPNQMGGSGSIRCHHALGHRIEEEIRKGELFVTTNRPYGPEDLSRGIYLDLHR